MGFGLGTILAPDAGTGADAIVSVPSAGGAGVDRVLLGILLSGISQPTREASNILERKEELTSFKCEIRSANPLPGRRWTRSRRLVARRQGQLRDATSSGQVQGSKRKRVQSCADAIELTLSPEFEKDFGACAGNEWVKVKEVWARQLSP